MFRWEKIALCLSISDEDKELAQKIVDEVRGGIPLLRTQSSLLDISTEVIAAVFSKLESERDYTKPHFNEKDSSWMCKSDFCWVDVRSCSKGKESGTFINAAKILFSISSSSILLAPFHPTPFELEYSPDSVIGIEPNLVDKNLLEKGISLENQLRAFISAAALLGKTVGYELMPFMSRLARTVIDKPELFHWVLLDEQKKGLLHADSKMPYTALDREYDAQLVKEICAETMLEHGVETIEYSENDSVGLAQKKEKAYFKIVHKLMLKGLWPIPAHARAGVGLPAFIRQENINDFPEFSYRDAEGVDVGSDAYGVDAPFAFYDEIPINNIGSKSIPRNDRAIDFYSHIFDYWRDNFGFDFVRYNTVDRLFDECIDEDGTIPVSDRPTPEVVSNAIAMSQKNYPGVGAIAARKGFEIEDYSQLGFDLTMGNETLRRIDSVLLADEFKLYDKLCSLDGKASVCFAVDVPEAAAPRLWGQPLVKVMGEKRMTLRHCMARFLSIGKARRPMFEVMGFQDSSSGLYNSSISSKALDWEDNKNFAIKYKYIEDYYSSIKDVLNIAYIEKHFVTDGLAWWQVRIDNSQNLIIVAVALETENGYDPGRVEIEIDPTLGELEGKAYNLQSMSSDSVFVNGKLTLDIKFLDCIVVELSPTFY